jgi:hypothetical protein
MFVGLFLTGDRVIDVSLTALLWFLIGILAGRHIVNWPTFRFRVRRAPRDEIAEMYVGNLAYEVGEKDLFKAFGEHGRVVSARIIRHKFGGKSKGFGFVGMGSTPEADAARKALNGRELKGRKLVVSEAKSRAR